MKQQRNDYWKDADFEQAGSLKACSVYVVTSPATCTVQVARVNPGEVN